MEAVIAVLESVLFRVESGLDQLVQVEFLLLVEEGRFVRESLGNKYVERDDSPGSVGVIIDHR